MGQTPILSDRYLHKIPDLLRPVAYPLNTPVDLDHLIDCIGDKRVVMLGEASHGTHEYYTWRAEISKRLIKEKGFNFIAVEGDWPDCYRINRYIKNYWSAGTSAFDVIHAFNRWPTWMWANWEMVAFTEWLYNNNQELPINQKTGFYGLDVYSLWESMEAIMEYLRKTDPGAMALAQKAFNCFEPYKTGEGSGYAYACRAVPDACRKEVVDLLMDIRSKVSRYNSDPENVFSTEQNALIAYNAERYYRAMIDGGSATWNIRDRHMEETLERLLDFYGKDSKAIIWAHNTHVGDARATDMAADGMINIGQLAREQFGEYNVFVVGFGSYEGSVIAGSRWGAPMKYTNVPQAVKWSWENMIHDSGYQDSYFITGDLKETPELERYIGHRAIGVVYNPDLEKFGNYVPTNIPERYDAFIYLDRTKALHPLHLEPDGAQMPATYPFGV